MSSDRIKKICIAVCFGFVVLSRSRPCVADDLEASLKQAYQGKVFVVRSFFRGNKLEYNENGNLSGHADTGLWTLDGLARLENIGLQGDTLRLKCKRLAIIASDADLDYIDQVKDAKLEIDVAFGSNHLDKKSTDVAFSKIFIEDQTAFLGSLPNYWKPCITAAINGADEKSRPVCHFSSL